MSPFLALFITLVLALAEIRALDFAAHRGWIESRLSRKLIHILTGPLFVLCWPVRRTIRPDCAWRRRSRQQFGFALCRWRV